MKSKGSTLGGIFLIAGTAIGGGMLALPVLTAAGGFLPAIVVYLLCWLFMAATGILVAEVFLNSPKETNLVSMAQATLGKGGKVAAWVLYLFLFYSLTIAYISGGGGLVGGLLGLKASWGPLLFTLIFAPIVLLGATVTARINIFLVIGLILSFFLFVYLGTSHIDLSLLNRSDLGLALLATPVVFTSFGFQGTVPTLTQYLDRDPQKIRTVILVGTAIPFLVYVIWEGLILGVVPLEFLHECLALGESAVYPLKKILHAPWLYTVGQFFAFFAIVTSFFGVTLGLIDFLSDGLNVKKTVKGKAFLGALVFFPPLIFSLINPCLFLKALQYAGGLGCALLLGLIPILMAWRGRYVLGVLKERLLPGGKALLSLLFLFIVFELGVICWKLFD